MPPEFLLPPRSVHTMANTSRFATDAALEVDLSLLEPGWLRPAVLTSGADDVVLASAADPERPGRQDSLASVAPQPLVTAAATAALTPSALVARDALNLALSRVARDASDGPAADDSVDLDAIDQRIHGGRCVCMACSVAGRSQLGYASATPLRCASSKISSGSSEPSMWMCSSALGMARASSMAFM